MCRAILLSISPLVLLGCAATPLQRFEYTRLVMGVQARIITHGREARTAERAASEAFDTMSAVEDAASDYRLDNELARLCGRAGQGFQTISPDLDRLLRLAEHFARLTDGAFDVTVGPATRLWRESRRAGRLPDPERLRAARSAIGWRLVVVDPAAPRARLLRPGMSLDFGGIAKGYAAQRALEVLRARGVPRSLVSLAGDVVAGEAPPGADGWHVAILGHGDLASNRSPRAHDPSSSAPHFILISNAAVSTSGDIEQYLEVGGVRYSHIVDPRTALGVTCRTAATVVAPDGETADALATALCVLGPAGLALLPPGVQARLSSPDGVVHRTSGWDALTRPAPTAPVRGDASASPGPPIPMTSGYHRSHRPGVAA